MPPHMRPLSSHRRTKDSNRLLNGIYIVPTVARFNTYILNIIPVNKVQRSRQIVTKVANNPHAAMHKLREVALGAPPAYVRTRLRTQDLTRQYARIRALREREEFLLVVLDACRYDSFESIAPEYLTFERIEPIESEGLNTFQYVSRCWPDTYPDLEYISAATPVNSEAEQDFDDYVLKHLYRDYVPGEHLLNIRDLWQDFWNPRIGSVPPEAVTDAALEAAGGRVVAHYFQPHIPYIGRQSLLGHADNEHSRPLEGEPIGAPIMERVRSGDVSRKELRQVYASNLRRVLREVRRLVAETDIETVVIMGDHGEALGEYGIYGHPSIEHPHVRVVPWAVIDGVARYPDRDRNRSSADASVEARLAELGYLE